MRILLITLLLGVSALPMSAEQSVAPADTTLATPRVLKDIEVLGMKESPAGKAIASTFLRGVELRSLGIVAIKNLGEVVPNLYSPSYGSRMTSSIYMRGLGSRIDQSVVGLNVDGVPMLNKDMYDTDIPDLSAVEVLRGAQSVLNGRNAMAGQINVYTLSPRDYQGVRAMVEGGMYDLGRVSIGGYFRVKEGLYTSVTAYMNHTDGYFRNEYNNSRVGVETNGALRWKVVFSPSAHHSITNTAAVSLGRQDGYPYRLYETDRLAYNDTCFYRRTMFSDGLTVAWRGKRVVVNSLTSVQYLDDNLTLDQDFTPEDYFTLTQKRREWTFTEDLFAKGSRGSYGWLTGVFAFHKSTTMDAPVTFFDTGIAKLIEDKRNEMNPAYPIRWDVRQFPLDSHFTNCLSGIAVYHMSSYDTGRWHFDAGLRLDVERATCRYRSDADAAYTIYHIDEDVSEVFSQRTINIHERGRLKDTFIQLLPRLSVTYTYDVGNVYASFTKGYKSGGFNTQMFSDVLQQKVMETMGLSIPYKVDDVVSYKPETSLNFELGTHNSLFEGRLGVNVTAFFINCRNQQLTVFPPGLVTGRIMTNAGRTRSMGLECSLSYKPVDAWMFSLSYGYTNATFRTYNDGRADYRGKRVPYAPTHTLFASARWNMPFQVGTYRPALQITCRGVGDICWNEANTAVQPFYAMAGASFELANYSSSIRLWVDNMTATRYNVFYFLSMGNAFVQRGTPLQFGITLRRNINFD